VRVTAQRSGGDMASLSVSGIGIGRGFTSCLQRFPAWFP
jgi:hypothetical protein